MRSAKEIAFRLRQELTNLRLYSFPPQGQIEPRGVAPGFLPRGNGNRKTSCPHFLCDRNRAACAGNSKPQISGFRKPYRARTINRLAEGYKNGKSSGTAYFRLIPYLDVARAGDHKWIWELNRHQHLVVLAQAFLFSGDARYLREIEKEIREWLGAKPVSARNELGKCARSGVSCNVVGLGDASRRTSSRA